MEARGQSDRVPVPDAWRTAVHAQPRVDETPRNGAAPETCVFCGAPSTQVVYAWPDWLCRFLAEHQAVWCPEPAGHGLDLVMVERAEREADKTAEFVCRTCSEGWMRRLEDNVSPFLTAMILGDPTPLPTARRKLLARWAAKTAVLIERAAESSFRTPCFASDHLRKVGVHAGTQVLVGKYDGQLQMLTSERDLSLRSVDGEQRHLSQTSLVMGSVLIQVFADPWRTSPPELTENAVRPFIPLIGNHAQRVVWPPDVVVDDALYDLVRLGTDAEKTPLQGSREVQEGHGTIMANNTNGHTDAPRTEAASTDANIWSSLLTFEATSKAGNADSTLRDLQLPVDPSAPLEEALEPAAKRPRSALAFAAVAGFVAIALLAFGISQRSDAARLRTKSATAERRATALEAQVRVRTQQLKASQARTAQLNARVANLTAPDQPATNDADLLQLVNSVPSATDALRRCASSALATASDALDFAAAFPTSAARVNAAASTVASVCGQASAGADKLDDLVDSAKR